MIHDSYLYRMKALTQENVSTPYTTSCEILRGGQAYFDRYIHVIESSREVLHLHVYRFNDDEIGKKVQEALIRASQRGVQVFIVVDGIGSGGLSTDFLKKFQEAGIRLRFFSKLHFSIPFRMGRRLHHKLLVADYQKAIVGGVNIADRYWGVENQLPWLDFAVYLEGTICVRLHNLAVKILNRKNYKTISFGNFGKPNIKKDLATIRILENDFFKAKLEVRKSYEKAIKSSRQSLIIFASYFLPNFKLLGFLEKAVKRGVAVMLVLPQKSDVMIYQTAVKYYYHWLLQRGIKIYEYPLSFLHAKAAVADHQWCTIGSYNLNDLSDLLSIELNIEISDRDIVAPFQQQLLTIIQEDCIEIHPKDYVGISTVRWGIWMIHYYLLINILNFTYWLTDKSKEYPLE